MDRLAQLQLLLAIVDTGSLAAAGRRLGRSPAAVTRALADLENRVGVRLIERSTRSCKPTPSGRRLAETARRLIEDYEGAISLPSEAAAALVGSLRVTAPTGFGAEQVAPLLLRFLDRHPGISVDLRLLDRVVDLIEEDFDLAVRIGRPREGTLIMRSAGVLRRSFVASPAYLQEHGVPRSLTDLAAHQLIQHGDGGNDAPWTFGKAGGAILPVAASGRLAVNRPEPAVAAARDGRGIVAVLSSQVANDLAGGTLLRVLQDHEPPPLPVSVLYPASRKGWRRVSLLADFLVTELTSSFSQD
ncbi:transcriptional regulator, LysR family [Sphingomonas gellani]|uniref:Transcriptional regulator, LysR family n=1 Tax=Sphingomonas gellani TaxID=1166340 RepID=A0A1H8JBU3_9SPHN|nr:LysR family transcriptional regulator [Sphingomonas gellani]SEN77667.1 transcriptional regulator, LysR family [Sphingomonas gellani]